MPFLDITIISSAFLIVDNLCAITIVVLSLDIKGELLYRDRFARKSLRASTYNECRKDKHLIVSPSRL